MPTRKRGAAGLTEEPLWPRAAASVTRLLTPKSACWEGPLISIGDQPLQRGGKGVGEGSWGDGERSVTPQGDTDELWLPRALGRNPFTLQRPLPRSKSPLHSRPRQGEGWGTGCLATRWESSGQRPDRGAELSAAACDSRGNGGQFSENCVLVSLSRPHSGTGSAFKTTQSSRGRWPGSPDPWCAVLGEVGSLEVEVWGASPTPPHPCESEAVGAAGHWGPGVAKRDDVGGALAF